jgi:hypothetical protein
VIALSAAAAIGVVITEIVLYSNTPATISEKGTGLAGGDPHANMKKRAKEPALPENKQVTPEAIGWVPSRGLVSLRPFRNNNVYYVGHEDSKIKLIPVADVASGKIAKPNVTFSIVPGLANPVYCSLRATNATFDHYWTHGDFRMRLGKTENTLGFQRNSTFMCFAPVGTGTCLRES